MILGPSLFRLSDRQICRSNLFCDDDITTIISKYLVNAVCEKCLEVAPSGTPCRGFHQAEFYTNETFAHDRLPSYSCVFGNATIEYSLESVCVCLCLFVFADNSKRNLSRNTKLEYIDLL